MTGPLWLLAAGAVGIGYFGSDFAALAGGAYHFHVGMSGILGTACALIGLLLSWLIYGSHRLSPQTFRFVAPIGWLARSGLVDRFFEFAYRRGALVFADAVGFFDRYVIDGVMNWIGWSTITSGRWLRRILRQVQRALQPAAAERGDQRQGRTDRAELHHGWRWPTRSRSVPPAD